MSVAVDERRPDWNRVRAEVARLLERHGFDSPPVDPVEIARGEGIDVRFVTFSGEFENVSGFFDPADNSITVNKNEWPLRQTFTIAHELGHAMLHRGWAASEDYGVLWRDEARNDRRGVHEVEANFFAAHLLVPRNMLDKWYDDLSVSELSRLFAVSVPVIKNRLSSEYGI